MGGAKTPEILSYEWEYSVDVIRGLQFLLFLCDCQIYFRTRDNWKSLHNVLRILHNLKSCLCSHHRCAGSLVPRVVALRGAVEPAGGGD